MKALLKALLVLTMLASVALTPTAAFAKVGLFGHEGEWEIQTMIQDASGNIIDFRSTLKRPGGELTIILDRHKRWALEISFFDGLKPGQSYTVRSYAERSDRDKPVFDYSFQMTARTSGILNGKLPDGWVNDNIDHSNYYKDLHFSLANKKVTIRAPRLPRYPFTKLMSEYIDQSIEDDKKRVKRNKRLAAEEARSKRLGVEFDSSNVDIPQTVIDKNYKRNVGPWKVASKLRGSSKTYVGCAATLKGNDGSLIISVDRSGDYWGLSVSPAWKVVDRHLYQSRLKLNNNEVALEMGGNSYYGELIASMPDGWLDSFASSKNNSNLSLWAEKKKMAWKLTDTANVVRILKECVTPVPRSKVSSREVRKKGPVKTVRQTPLKAQTKAPVKSVHQPLAKVPAFKAPVQKTAAKSVRQTSSESSAQKAPTSQGFEIIMQEPVGAWDIGAMYENGQLVGCLAEIKHSGEKSSIAILASPDNSPWQLRFPGVKGFDQPGERVEVRDQVNGMYSSHHEMYVDGDNGGLFTEVYADWLEVFFGTPEERGQQRNYQAWMYNMHASWDITGAYAASEALFQCLDLSNGSVQTAPRHQPKSAAQHSPRH